jgi:hypothetical protein
MTEIIATLALLTSIILLFVHYTNQVERRHGDITMLRSDFLKRLDLVHQRLVSGQMHLETARIELRRMPDCDEKYDSIEKIPEVIQIAQRVVQKQGDIKDNLKGMDTTKFNTSKTLLLLQSMETDIQSLEEDTSSYEQKVLLFLETIRLCIKEEKSSADMADGD